MTPCQWQLQRLLQQLRRRQPWQQLQALHGQATQQLLQHQQLAGTAQVTLSTLAHNKNSQHCQWLPRLLLLLLLLCRLVTKDISLVVQPEPRAVSPASQSQLVLWHLAVLLLPLAQLNLLCLRVMLHRLGMLLLLLLLCLLSLHRSMSGAWVQCVIWCCS
jgi:hypothetical protein